MLLLPRSTLLFLILSCRGALALAKSSITTTTISSSSSSSRTTTSTLILLRGGAAAAASPWSKSKPSSSSPWGSSSSSSSARRAPPLQRPWQQQQQSSSSSTTTTTLTDDEKDRAHTKEILDAFLTRDSRNTFIARVYAILAVQLLFTAGSVFVFGTQPSLSNWMVQTNSFGAAVPMLSLLLSTICWFVMCVSSDARHVSPLKWQLLSLFTLGEAVSVGFISSFYTFQSVVSAMLATATAATAVSVYTATQKNPHYDLSQWGAGLSSAGLIFLVYGIIQLLQVIGVLPAGFLPYNDALYGLMGACLFSFYLAYHTKLIVSGKNTKYQMNEKDYVFGAMTLYNDIINLFIYTLRLIGEDRKKQ